MSNATRESDMNNHRSLGFLPRKLIQPEEACPFDYDDGPQSRDADTLFVTFIVAPQHDEKKNERKETWVRHYWERISQVKKSGIEIRCVFNGGTSQIA